MKYNLPAYPPQPKISALIWRPKIKKTQCSYQSLEIHSILNSFFINLAGGSLVNSICATKLLNSQKLNSLIQILGNKFFPRSPEFWAVHSSGWRKRILGILHLSNASEALNSYFICVAFSGQQTLLGNKFWPTIQQEHQSKLSG